MLPDLKKEIPLILKIKLIDSVDVYYYYYYFMLTNALPSVNKYDRIVMKIMKTYKHCAHILYYVLFKVILVY